MNVLNWITSRVRTAVLKGFAEAAEELELTNDTDSDAPGALDCLKERLKLAAPSNGDKLVRSKAK